VVGRAPTRRVSKRRPGLVTHASYGMHRDRYDSLAKRQTVCRARTGRGSFRSPLWRPAELVTVRFGPAPSSRDRVHDNGVWERPRAVTISGPSIKASYGDSRSGSRGKRRSRPVGGAGRSNICASSSTSDNGGSNRSSCCPAAVFPSMNSPANPSNARCREGAPDSRLSRVPRDICRRPVE
jgi:hypothetical protein